MELGHFDLGQQHCPQLFYHLNFISLILIILSFTITNRICSFLVFPLTAPLQRSFSASDHSDEEEPGGAAERWARIIDLPGFEDNVSASNYILVLFRLVAGEVSIHLARSSDHSDKPYLMLRAEKLCVDAAHMVYGPALQASLHRIQLVDKLHKGLLIYSVLCIECLIKVSAIFKMK